VAGVRRPVEESCGLPLFSIHHFVWLKNREDKALPWIVTDKSRTISEQFWLK